MSSTRDILESRFVLFSVEGAAEGVIIERLIDDGLIVVPRDRIVCDALYVDRPHTRTRKAVDIVRDYFGVNYAVDGAEGLVIARIVDSKSPRFDIPRKQNNGTEVLSFYTRPEIEMLVIHCENAYGAWLKYKRRHKGVKPSDFCKSELGIIEVKQTDFLKKYWSDGSVLAQCIRAHASKVQREQGDLLLADLLK